MIGGVKSMKMPSEEVATDLPEPTKKKKKNNNSNNNNYTCNDY